MAIPFAIVHHANQYLITNGYENRHGLRATLGSVQDKTGLAWILELHHRYAVPANVHVSGTLIEAIAWHEPAFLGQLRELCRGGLLEIVGSCYGQNIMRFFSYDHNLKQLNEELRLYETHLGIDPEQVKTFWPPERVWDTERMAAVLNDPRLLNRGYKYLLVALVNHPEKTCRALCEFLGLSFDDAMLRFYESEKADRKKKEKPDEDEEGVNAKHAWLPITPGLRDWRKQMAPEDIERFEAVAGELLDQLGYPRGVNELRSETLERAARVRAGFEGRPLPRGWEAASVV